MFLVKAEVFEDRYIFDIQKDLSLCPLTELQAEPQKIFLLQS